jgi:hypothetical protein
MNLLSESSKEQAIRRRRSGRPGPGGRHKARTHQFMPENNLNGGDDLISHHIKGAFGVGAWLAEKGAPF